MSIRKSIISALISFALLSPSAFATTYTLTIKVPGVPPPPPPKGCSANMTQIGSATTFGPATSNGNAGSVQNASVPPGATCASVVAVGADGSGPATNNGYYGGGGDTVTALVPVDAGSQLDVVVGIAGTSFSGGGLSGVFSGPPSSSTALVIAGGGGSAGLSSGNSPSAGGFASFSPKQPPVEFCATGSAMASSAGGPGYGGSSCNEGGITNYCPGSSFFLPTPFLYGAGCNGAGRGNLNSEGGFGGGGTWGQSAAPGAWLGEGGGGGGYVGGNGGSYVNSTYFVPGGGQSWVTPAAFSKSDAPKTLACRIGVGCNGSVTITYFKSN